MPPDCAATILPRFSVPDAITTPTSAKPIAISYATICAAERIAPRNAYFEFADQPARMMPYEPNPASASTYSTPASMLATEKPGHSEMTAHAAKAGVSDNSGAPMNRKRFDL